MNSPTTSVDADKSAFRSRLLSAMIESIVEDGYQNTTVADIVRRAKTSRRTFYEHFASREECFVALLTSVNTQHVREVARGVDRTAPWQAQVRQAVEAWIGSYQAHPELMLAWIRDLRHWGPRRGATARVDGEFHRDGAGHAGQRGVPLGRGIDLAAAHHHDARRVARAHRDHGGERWSGGEITEDAVLACTAMLTPLS